MRTLRPSGEALLTLGDRRDNLRPATASAECGRDAEAHAARSRQMSPFVTTVLRMGEIRFDELLHFAGEEWSVQNTQLSTTLAWWVAAELVRRHPGELRVIETHPGGGQYNCVSVYRITDEDGPEVVVHMNVDAGAHLTHGSWFDRGDDERFNWLEVLLCDNRRSYVVEQLERLGGLSSPTPTPRTTSESIGPMVISAFLERSVLGPARWTATNGVADSDGGLEVRRQLFDQFPDAAGHVSSVEGGLDGYGEYRFWFVGPAGDAGEFSLAEPAFVVDTWTGHLWARGRDRIDLLEGYTTVDRSLDALVSSACPPAF